MQEVIADYMPPISQLERHVGSLRVYASVPYTLASRKRRVTQRMHSPAERVGVCLPDYVRSSDSHLTHTQFVRQCEDGRQMR